MKRALIFISLLCSATLSQAAYTPPFQSSVNEARQMLVITTKNWNSVNGQLQRFQRNPVTLKWTALSGKLPVVVGRNGMGWGIDVLGYGYAGPAKAEHDYRTPAGVYKIGPAFGYPRKSPLRLKLPYIPVDDTYFCNDNLGDDYNQLIYNKDNPIQTEWRDVELFRWGAIIQYNMDTPIQGAGSCVFMHIWESPSIGTKGCVAMSVENLEAVLKWLDPEQNPVIVIMPKSEYKNLQKAWQLPSLS